MRQVFVIAHNIISPLGYNTKENFSQLEKGQTGVRNQHDSAKSDLPFYASLFPKEEITDNEHFTKFEQLLIKSIGESISQFQTDLSSEKTGLIISSTKGNISLIESNRLSPELVKRIGLHSSAKKISDYFGFSTKPIIVSNACISGLVALITARRLIASGKMDTIIVSGADVITKFILSGFQAFQAVSDDPCKPFDANRKGINLGEAAATVVLSAHQPENEVITLSGGAVSNDANHISGPSRTGAELFQSIEAAIKEAQIDKGKIDFISAHGTATHYNDDMESKAISLAGLQHIPLNSLKGYYGHTLGAAGLLETVISIESLLQGKIIPTMGFEILGTAQPVHVCSSVIEKKLNRFLKTASGFGGCNAAIIVEKI